MVGPENRLCLQSNRWSGNPTFCQPLLCEILEPPENGVVLVPCHQEYGSICTVECLRGYKIDGPTPFRQTCILNSTTGEVEWTEPTVCIGRDVL